MSGDVGHSSFLYGVFNERGEVDRNKIIDLTFLIILIKPDFNQAP